MIASRSLLTKHTGGYTVYRAPAAVRTAGGTLMLFLEARRGQGSDFDQTDLVVLHSLDDGETWGQPQCIYADESEPDTTIGNPAPVYDAHNDRTLVLFTRNNDRVFVVCSDDEGTSWEPPTEISAEVTGTNWTRYWVGPGHGIQLIRGPRAGRLIVPSYHMANVAGRTLMRSHSVYSDDHGETWDTGSPTGIGPDINFDATHDCKDWVPSRDYWWTGCECMAAELTDGRLYLTVRNQPEIGDRKAFACSQDNGNTWSPVRFCSDLPGMRCQSSVATTTWHDGDVLLWAGIASGWATGMPRACLTLFASTDGGATFPISHVVHEAAAAYSDLVVLPDRTVLVFYEGGADAAHDGIRLARVALAALLRGESPNVSLSPSS